MLKVQSTSLDGKKGLNEAATVRLIITEGQIVGEAETRDGGIRERANRQSASGAPFADDSRRPLEVRANR